MTNKTKTTLYIGVTNDLRRRLWEHINEPKGFVKRYKVDNLIYCEHYDTIMEAIDREKQLKRWNREKKEALIATVNPDWVFMNEDVLS